MRKRVKKNHRREATHFDFDRERLSCAMKKTKCNKIGYIKSSSIGFSEFRSRFSIYICVRKMLIESITKSLHRASLSCRSHIYSSLSNDFKFKLKENIKLKIAPFFVFPHNRSSPGDESRDFATHKFNG